MVNTWPTGRWLGERLAEELGGVAANLRFPFPAARLRQLVDELLGEEDAAGPDPWRASRLVWPVLELLPALAATAQGAPLRRWLDPHREGGRADGGRLDLASWQLGRTIADAFDDYALYRPELLAAWGEGRLVDGRGGPLPEGLRWQPQLYAALRQRLRQEPGGLRSERAIARLRQRSRSAPGDGR